MRRPLLAIIIDAAVYGDAVSLATNVARLTDAERGLLLRACRAIVLEAGGRPDARRHAGPARSDGNTGG